MAYFYENTGSRGNTALADCGCGCGGAKPQQQLSNGYRRRRRGLSDAKELQEYISIIREKLATETVPQKRAELEQELQRYEGLLREELAQLSIPGVPQNVPQGAPQHNSDEKSFLTDDSLISGVPNWVVGLGAVAAGYAVYELAS